LESLELPQNQLFELCQNRANELDYSLRSLEKDKLFFYTIETQVVEYITQIELTHLPTQREKEKYENDEKDNELEGPETQVDSSIDNIL